MLYNIYSIKDEKTGFLTPTIDVNDDSALRNFQYACMNADSLFFTFPSDYSLYRLGQYESDIGHIICDDVPIFLCSASSFVKKEGVV